MGAIEKFCDMLEAFQAKWFCSELRIVEEPRSSINSVFSARQLRNYRFLDRGKIL